MKRREFIRLSGLASLPLLAPGLVFGAAGGPARDRVLLCIFQRGGADGLNMVVPHGDGHYYDRRPTLAVAPPGSSDGAIDLDGFHGLHPAMDALEPIYRTGALAVVHAVGSPGLSRSHFDAQDLMESGVLDKGLAYDGWLNRHLGMVAGEDSSFRAVALGGAPPRALSGELAALGLNSLDGFDLRATERSYGPLRDTLLALHQGDGAIDQEALRVFEAIETLQGVPTPDGGAIAYPDSEFGRQLSDVARLAKAQVGLQLACLDIGGWDHHDRENERLPGLLGELSAGLASFHAEMADAPVAVTVITMTEFGRRAEENASGGTDHGHGSVMLALGAGVNGGQVIADWPGLAPEALNRGDLEVTIDYRSVLAEVLAVRCGNPDSATVFPGFDGPTSLGLFRS